MELYLLRHAIAEDAGPGQTDEERALTPPGKEKLRRVLKRAAIRPSLILSSPYRRALETAAIAAEVFQYTGEIVRTRALVPEAAPNAIWDEIRALRGESGILLAGHQPHMSLLASFLLNCPTLEIDMKKAALLRIDCDRMGARPAGVLKWMLTPAVAE